MEPLPFVGFDIIANKTCREINDEELRDQSVTPHVGGTKTRYAQKLAGHQKTPDCDEVTIVQWSGTATEIILYDLIKEYEQDKRPASLDHRTCKVGMSFKAHKKSQNIFQILYVKQSSNQIM